MIRLDKEVLRQYNSHKAEMVDLNKNIEALQNEIDKLSPKQNEVADVVTKGRKGKKPLGTCKVHGYEDHRELNRKRVKLRGRKAKRELMSIKIEDMVLDAEEYIDNLEDSELRRILRFKCIEGNKNTSWADVAEKMGEGYTEEACKQIYSRFMRVK